MELKSRGLHWTIILLYLYILGPAIDCSTSTPILAGKRTACSNEGEPIEITHIDTKKCLSCICKNGFVECHYFEDCPKTEGCHMVVEKTDDGCCQKCQGCMFRGLHHASHTEWTDPREPCTVMRCEAGVVTQSTLMCHTPCANPIKARPGKCCDTCPDCTINGQIATSDRDVTSDDPCVKCRCDLGRMTCSKQACPVLQCLPERQVQPPGECCPRCTGTRSLFKPPQQCILVNQIYSEGRKIKLNQCTTCECQNETSICQRESCPVLNCAPDLLKKNPKSCCMECREPEIDEMRSQCSYDDKIYEEAQQWRLDDCSSCICHRGMPSCAKTRCNVTLSCPPGTKLVQRKGECCKVCQENDGVCMVFGDPHYKSFDGKIFSFQGIGKYQLVSDCHGHSFSIRVANAFQGRNKSSTLTKRVSIKFGEIRVNLGQRFKTRVNGEPIEIPYKHRDGRMRIEHQQENILLSLSNGVKVLWSGRSFLEITVPTTFKSRLCGLCGNFNGNVGDDFRTRKGIILPDERLIKFGTNWCVGPHCAKNARRTALIRTCRPKQRNFSAEQALCKYLTSTELFNGCDSKLNNDKYRHACLVDMCDCPGGKCYCESLTAYAQECKRLGVTLRNWQKNSYCTAADLRQPSLSPLNNGNQAGSSSISGSNIPGLVGQTNHLPSVSAIRKIAPNIEHLRQKLNTEVRRKIPLIN